MERKRYVDVAKVIGLLCIVLAHVSIPPIIAQLRNFDVPLMVLLSGILAQGACEKMATKQQTYIAYVRKRFVRLVLPVWLFLIPFIIGRVVFIGDLTFSRIIGSFLLTRNSIGYVWIIMVYLICALLIPLLSRVDIFSAKHLAVVAIIYLLFELACVFRFTTKIGALDDMLYYIVPYGCVTLLGLNYEKLSKKARLITAASCLTIFGIIAVILYMQKGSFVYTQEWKYPARTYYLSYAIGVGLFVLEAVRSLPQKVLCNKMIAFISRSSLWIYLWHILMLWLVPACVWPARYVMIFASSCIIAFIQERVVVFLEKKNFPKNFLRILRG